MPSLQEGLGLSVMEAQAAGVPVVVSNVGGLPDLVKEGMTGLLAMPGQAEDLATKIILSLAEPGHSQTMALSARLMIEEQFSLERMTKGTVSIYEQNLSR
jgi:glycosyltransferase involved in cell wall biosynthesis